MSEVAESAPDVGLLQAAAKRDMVPAKASAKAMIRRVVFTGGLRGVSGALPAVRQAARGALVAAGLVSFAGCSDRSRTTEVVTVTLPAPASASASTSASVTVTATVTATVPAAVSVTVPEAPAGDGACADSESIAVFASPEAPAPGKPLRVVAVSTKPHEAGLVVYGPDGSEAAKSVEMHSGPPAWWTIEISSPSAGLYKAVFGAKGHSEACKAINVGGEPEKKPTRWGPVWGVRAAWGEAMENLYSAWIEHLFDAPLEEQPSWPALHEVLRDPKRNLLHNHRGLDEDNSGPGAVLIDPDCADLPYFLRAYFSAKMGLPFAFSSCTRGSGGAPPRCIRFHTSMDPGSGSRRGPAAALGEFLRTRVADVVHSGNGRIPADDSKSDYYSVKLSVESLRPGAVYADPYGHMLVVAKRIPQTESSGGVLLAVDGQPDGTVARRRYWRGNFLFALEPALGSPGFKRFRPVLFETRRARELTNEEILKAPGYGDFSTEQYDSGVEGFYDKMDEVLSPAPQSAERVMLETIQALYEQVKGRVLSVQNGQAHKEKSPETIEMPEGATIFETTGAWEDFSTPSRDLRLLIAIDIVRGFPDRVARRPERFAAAGGKGAAEMKTEFQAILERELRSKTVTYTRSDGSPFTLSLTDVLARAEALEVAYNPNDCSEVRWGAPAGSDEAKTCKRRAPADQRARMERTREWFHKRSRPPRG